MNLQELLAHRTKCLIHNRVMIPYYLGIGHDKAVITTDGLEIKVHSKCDEINKPSLRAMVFRFDGSYFTTNNCPDYLTQSPLIIYMMCSDCRSIPIIKDRALGHTALSDLRVKQQYYTFTLIGDAGAHYEGHLVKESVKYHNSRRFYHVSVNLETHESNIKMGSCELSDTLDEILQSMVDLDLPYLNLEKVTDLDKLMNKIRLYNVFS